MKNLCFNLKNRAAVKNLLIALCLCVFCLSAQAQTDTIVYKQERKGYKREVKVVKFKYSPEIFLDFGYNGADKYNFFTDASDASMGDFPKLRAAQSKAFSMYFTGSRKLFGNLSLMSGFGFDWFNYRFRNGVTLKEINGTVQQIPVNELYPFCVHVEKSKLVSSYFTVPILLRLNFHGFFVAAGVTGSINISSHTRVIYHDALDNEHKYRDYDINTAPFRYGFTARAGYGILSVFANYYMTTLFPKHEGIAVYPFSMGISLRMRGEQKISVTYKD